jgi:nitroreductase
MTDRSLNAYPDSSALLGFLRSLRTVRCFESEPVPEEVVRDVLEVARWSGSALNCQPWEFLVVRERGSLESLATCEGYAGHLASARGGIVLVMAGEAEKFEQETFDEGRLSKRSSLAAASCGVASSVGCSREMAKRRLKRFSRYRKVGW